MILIFIHDLSAYVTFNAVSTDGSQHDVKLFFDASPDIATNKPSQKTLTNFYKENGFPEFISKIRNTGATCFKKERR